MKPLLDAPAAASPAAPAATPDPDIAPVVAAAPAEIVAGAGPAAAAAATSNAVWPGDAPPALTANIAAVLAGGTVPLCAFIPA